MPIEHQDQVKGQDYIFVHDRLQRLPAGSASPCWARLDSFVIKGRLSTISTLRLLTPSVLSTTYCPATQSVRTQGTINKKFELMLTKRAIQYITW